MAFRLARGRDRKLFADDCETAVPTLGELTIRLEHHGNRFGQVLFGLFQCGALRIRPWQLFGIRNPVVFVLLEDGRKRASHRESCITERFTYLSAFSLDR